MLYVLLTAILAAVLLTSKHGRSVLVVGLTIIVLLVIVGNISYEMQHGSNSAAPQFRHQSSTR